MKVGCLILLMCIIAPMELVASRLKIINNRYMKSVDLYLINCARCGGPTGLKSKAEIARQIKVSGAVYCCVKCKLNERIPTSNCATCNKECKPFIKKGKRGRFCSKVCYSAWQSTDCNKKDNNPNWRGGYQGRNSSSPEYIVWRAAVYDRDNYTCQKCQDYAGTLNAHHLKCWSQYPELRFNVANGITLCEPCHNEVHLTKDPKYIVGSAPSTKRKKRNEASYIHNLP